LPGMDHLSPEQRSKLMSRIRRRDTKPEIVVRRVAHALGYRYRLHRADLPGCPDLVFGPRRKVIFVHGCFWASARLQTWDTATRIRR
jgi:DNA mismatch endonuclease (patch repair protein)